MPLARPYRLLVALTEAEKAILEARAAAEESSKAAVLRSALAAKPSPVEQAALTRNEALALLERSARDGSVLAQVALARELRLEPVAKRSTGRRSRVRLAELAPGTLRAV